MKQETKQTIDWIKKQINLAKENCINPAHKDGYPEYEDDYEKAMKFLDSLPEIESKLCQGGYIQDKNGTPCCNGDRISNKSILDDEEEIGILYWSKKNSRFYCKNLNGLLVHLSIDFTKVD